MMEALKFWELLRFLVEVYGIISIIVIVSTKIKRKIWK